MDYDWTNVRRISLGIPMMQRPWGLEFRAAEILVPEERAKNLEAMDSLKTSLGMVSSFLFLPTFLRDVEVDGALTSAASSRATSASWFIAPAPAKHSLQAAHAEP